MARLFRQHYTKPLPEGAKIITGKGKPHARFTDDGRTVTAPLTKKGDRIRLLSAKWYGEYRDADGFLRRVPLALDRSAAEVMLGELVKQAELTRRGLADPVREEHARRPLTEHLADWQASLLAHDVTAKHVRQTVANVRRVLDACRFVTLADLSVEPVEQFLAGLRNGRKPVPPLDPAKEEYTKAELAQALGVKASSVPSLVRRHRLEARGKGKRRRYPKATAEALRTLRVRGRSVKTSNLYLDGVKAFCAWLVERGRALKNPLAHLSGGNVKADRRHDRRALPLED